MDVAMKFLHLKVLKKLNDVHIRWMTVTTFLHLFAFPVRTHVSNAILYEILLMWDNKGHFKVRDDKLLEFTADEVAIVMCLSSKGDNIQYKREYVGQYHLRTKYFGRTGRISQVDLENAIVKALDDKQPEKEVVDLLVMYLFTTILFSQTCGKVHIHMFSYAENLLGLKDYNWSDGVYRILMDNILNNANWCKLKRDGKGLQIEEAESLQEEVGKNRKKQPNPSGTLAGCAIALIVWFLELVKIVKMNIYTRHIPSNRD